MNRFSRYLKIETDVEVFAACHVFMYIFIYGFYCWLDHKTNVSFQFIVQATIMGYIISWIQKLLFMKKGVYSKIEYKLYSSIWFIAPIVITLIAEYMLNWFVTTSDWVKIAFDLTFIVYYPFFFFLLECFYKEDTKELNTLLKHYKDKNKQE